MVLSIKNECVYSKIIHYIHVFLINNSSEIKKNELQCHKQQCGVFFPKDMQNLKLIFLLSHIISHIMKIACLVLLYKPRFLSKKENNFRKEKEQNLGLGSYGPLHVVSDGVGQNYHTGLSCFHSKVFYSLQSIGHS